MITGYDPEAMRLSIGIGDLIGLERLPVTLVPSENPLSLHHRQRAHSSYQRTMMDRGWEREVNLRRSFRAGGMEFDISGRADLLLDSEEGLQVLEIKTCGDGETHTDPVEENPEHVLQLYFYALALQETRDLPPGSVGAGMVYISLGPGGETVSRHSIDLSDRRLEDLWRSLLEDTADAVIREERRREEQTAALDGFSFPYVSPRPGQSLMMEEVGGCVDGSGYLMVQAPTGTGKTAAIIAGAIGSALPRRLSVFFLTAKNTHKLIVAETLGLIIDQGVPLRCLFIASKAAVCLMGRERCLPHDCPYAVDFAERVRSSGVMDELLDKGLIETSDILQAARRAEVCAFELSLCLSTRCDILVCDYNYVFDPHVFLKRFFLESRTSSRCCLLIDEAANLPSRARGYYSPEIRESWISELSGSPPTAAVDRLLSPWRECFEEWSNLLKDPGTGEVELPSKTSVPSDPNRWLEEIMGLREPPEAMSDMVRSLMDFSRIDPEDGRFHLLFRRDGDELVLQWFCTDPSGFLRERLESCHSRIAFSATLAPFEHFGHQLGFPSGETRHLDIGYPFPRENLGVWICPEVDTRYRYRNRQLSLLVEMILGIFGESRGTWIVFFPSYGYMDAAARALEGPGVPLLVQRRNMDRSARLDFIQRIETEENLVLTVSGGIFSEGLDIRSQALRGAMVVGPSLPGLDLRLRLLSGSYEERGMNGFLHTWAVPGMVRVIQAAGRLIRNSSQRRALILLGRRFTRQPYFGLLPAHWFRGGSIPIMRDDTSPVGDFLREDGRKRAAPKRRPNC